MKKPLYLTTERTILRNLTLDDVVVFYGLNLDPEVIQFTGDEPFEDIGAVRDFLPPL